jgi:hypothetical protein
MQPAHRAVCPQVQLYQQWSSWHLMLAKGLLTLVTTLFLPVSQARGCPRAAAAGFPTRAVLS